MRIIFSVNEVGEESFRLTIIPHTLENTLMREYEVGTSINIETDIFARYIDHILTHKLQPQNLWAGVKWIQWR
jgi:riboflavin synthase